MKLYLDTFDLINLLERGTAGITPEEFKSFLIKSGHTIVLSFQTICELIAPLWDPDSKSVITKTMNRLDELPHEWIDLTRLPNMEVKEALRATKSSTPYVRISPYVGNYVATILNAPELLKVVIHYPLAEIAFDLWRSGSFDPRKQRERHVATYRQLVEDDRKLISTMTGKAKAREELFVLRTISRIKAFGLHDPGDKGNDALFEKCARQIMGETEWCPGSKMAFSAFHSLIDNVGDKLQDSDLGDLTHVYAVPYVDFFTCDRRISSHIVNASKIYGMNHHEKVFPNIKALLGKLGTP